MQYQDRVFGEVTIDEPVIVELINCPAFQRLKGVDQAGYKALWVKIPKVIREFDNTRYAHSIGVYLWLRRFGAPLEEQIAGLIHDVSHSVFSHCIDYAVNSGSSHLLNHQDSIFADYVHKTEIPGILGKYGIDLDYILDEHNFPLKEKSLPDVCADRLDYLLRDASLFEELNEEEKKYILDNVMVENNDWIFKNKESAKKYSMLFWKMNNKYYSIPLAACMFMAVADYVKHGLDRGYVTWTDLYTTDSEVLKKIASHHEDDAEAKLLFARMNERDAYVLDSNMNGRRFACKSRMVDPLCYDGGKVTRLSELDEEIKKIMKTELEPKVYYLRIKE